MIRTTRARAAATFQDSFFETARRSAPLALYAVLLEGFQKDIFLIEVLSRKASGMGCSLLTRELFLDHKTPRRRPSKPHETPGHKTLRFPATLVGCLCVGTDLDGATARCVKCGNASPEFNYKSRLGSMGWKERRRGQPAENRRSCHFCHITCANLVDLG